MSTAVNEEPLAPKPSPLSWKIVGPGLWVGSDPAGPAAVVTEVWTAGFEAALTSGQSLGLHPTAASARDAAEAALAS